MRFLFFFLCLPCFVLSQDISEQYIDSIISLPKDKEYSSFKRMLRKVNLLSSEISIAKYKYIDSLVKDNDSLRLYTNIYHTSTLMRYGENEEALKLNSKGLKLAEKYDWPYFQLEHSQLRANIFQNMAVLDSNVFYINKAENIIHKNETTLGHHMARIYQQRAHVEQSLGNTEKEDFYIEKVAEVIEAYPEKNMTYQMSTVVYHFKLKKNYAKHAYYSQKYKAYKLKKNGLGTPKKHQSISSMLKMDNTDEQINDLKRILNTSDSLKYNRYLSQTANTLGEKFIEVGKHEKAIAYLKKSLAYNKENMSLYSELISYQNLYLANYKLKKYEKAITASNKIIELHHTIRKKEMLDKVADLEVSYNIEKKTAQVQLLKAENRNKEQQKQLYLILALSGLIVASLFAFFAYKNGKQKLILAKQKDELETTVEQKNVLFKEIHHRVKNSLQMVSSLLFLQSENVGDKEAKNAIKDAQNRVRSLGLIHQKLYNKKHLIGVETKDYITELTKDIFNSHQLESQNLSYNLNIENMVLSVDTLTPIGLILNELIVNVLKHAFKEDAPENKLYIKFYKSENTLILKVTDNGIGYRGQARENSFGIKLINALSKKLEASFSITAKQPNGTEAILQIIDFELIEPK